MNSNFLKASIHNQKYLYSLLQYLTRIYNLSIFPILLYIKYDYMSPAQGDSCLMSSNKQTGFDIFTCEHKI